MTGQKGATTPQLDPDSLELAPGTEHQNLEGWAPVLGSDAEVLDALEKAFDYAATSPSTARMARWSKATSSIARPAQRSVSRSSGSFLRIPGETFDRLQRDRRPDLYRQRPRGRR